jgi:phenylacetate-CoA ligase
MSFALDVYHRLPPVSRSMIASIHGYHLRRWRYDKFTDQLVEQALERDRWSKEQWQNWQSERLSFVLERAATKVPYYRRLWSERRRKGDRSSFQYLENWPVLEKQELRSNARDLVADDRDASRMFHDHTSGTTGTSLDIWLTRPTVKEWYALFEARCRYWHGLSRHDRWAILGGQLITPVRQAKPPFWVWNAGLKQLYLSSYHLSQNSIPAYLDALAKYRIRYVLGYPSAIYTLARGAVSLERNDITLEVAITNAEPIYEYQRNLIREAFKCEVRETYGMAEIAAAASECENGALHQWPDAGVIEVEGGGQTQSADLICTGLVNADMPLIRYRVGDRGSFSDTNCACGRNLPCLENIDGRTDDVLYTSDGRAIGRLDPIFKGQLPVAEAQIIQESLSKLRVLYVPADDVSAGDLKVLADRIRDRMGDVEIEFEKTAGIPRTNRGKFRAVVCKIPADARGETAKQTSV